MKLRDYQQTAIDETYAYWEHGKGRHPVIIAPTAAGKSLIIAKLCQDVCAYSDESRVLIVTHVRELIEQNSAELLGIWAQADVGLFSASLGKKQHKNQIVFAGVQSFWDKAHTGDPFDVVIVDEAHMIPHNDQTRYQKLFEILELMNPRVKIVGLTATPYRLNGGYIYEGKGAIFDGVSYDIPITKLLEDGYITPVISKGGVQSIDLTNVKKRGGEYVESDLAMAASDPELVRKVAAEVIAYGANRKAWLVFASGVSHAEMLCDEFIANGINAKTVNGKTEKKKRTEINNEFKNGQLKCLVSVGTHTTGFNAPICDLIALVRATMSTSLYVQMIGRGVRLAQDKESCLVLDYGNNVMTHGLIDKVEPRIQRSSGEGDAPVKTCPECETLVFAGARECPECGHEFPPPELNHTHTAYTGALISTQVKPETVQVDKVMYARHRKPGKADSLKVTYFSGLSIFQEWVCLEHEGHAKRQATKWIDQVGGKAKTIEEALNEKHLYRQPTAITVKPDGKFTRIISKSFSD